MSRPDISRAGRVSCSSIGLAVLVFLTAAASAQQPIETVTTAPVPRPRIGLVLAGGGAKGGAHVGVLKVLEELHVPVDCVAGTSMGAVVGGGYAAGLSASELEQFLKNVDWKTVIGGVGDRPFEPAQQKRATGAAAFRFEFAVKDQRITGPGGIVRSTSIESMLREYVSQARTVRDFDDLPIPFRAVATDMLSGTMVVLDHGDIATAMRASMAVPGAFSPVRTEQYVLSDGGMVRNIPVDVARNLCADVVIVVNLLKPPVTPDQLRGAISLAARSMDVMIQANETVQLQSLTDRDVRIDVEPGNVGFTEFERMPETIPLGEAAARKMAARLAPLAFPESQYADWRRRVAMRQGIQTTVADVRFEGLKRVNPEYLRSLTRIRPGEQVNGAMISEDARRMAVLNDIATIDYELVGDPANPVLVWRPVEDPFGPDYLRVGLGVYLGGGGDVGLLLGLQHVRYWLNSLGGTWRNSAQIGTFALLDSNFYQPLNVRQSVFIQPDVFVSRSVEDVFNDNQQVATYLFIDRGLRFDAGANLSLNAQARFGYWIDRRNTEVYTGFDSFPTVSVTDAGPAAAVSYDSRDATTFATGGMAAEARFLGSDATLGGTRDWETIEAAIRKAVVLGNLRVWLTAAGGSEIGDDLPPDRAFALGGPESFPGYGIGELRARKYWVAGGNFLYPLTTFASLKEQNLYGGLGLQAGDLYERVDPVPNGRVYSISAFFGGRTPVGTLTFGAGTAGGTTHSWAFWIVFGRTVGHGSILDEDLFR
jgi:NTE family protein